MTAERLDGVVAVLEKQDLTKSADGSAPASRERRIVGIVLGRIVALRDPELALVVLKGRESAQPIRARILAGLTRSDSGREVALMFEEGDPGRPVIIGCLEDAPTVGDAASKDGIAIDAQSIVFTGEKEIVLRSGEASITLRKDGRVVVRGAYVETRSQGVNRIKGGSVQIN